MKALLFIIFNLFMIGLTGGLWFLILILWFIYKMVGR